MTKEEFLAFKRAWEDYPSQDNEGFQPDRGGFKCGWAAALDWVRERETMRLAAISSASLCNTERTVKNQRIDKDNPYWTVAYQDVCRAVDREMELRKELNELKKIRVWGK